MNQKIKNANPKLYNGIEFKSTLEVSCYKKLEQTDFEYAYEPEKIVILQGNRLERCEFYAPLKHHGKLEPDLSRVEHKIIAITYTPDFVVRTGSIVAYFDVKGFPNDSYALKKKMFLNLLEHRNDGKAYMFFEPHSVRQMVQAVETINEKKKLLENINDEKETE